jgi:hypothetical protein
MAGRQPPPVPSLEPPSAEEASSALASLVGAAAQASRGAGLPSWTTALEAARRAEILQSSQLRSAVGRGGVEGRGVRGGGYVRLDCSGGRRALNALSTQPRVAPSRTAAVLRSVGDLAWAEGDNDRVSGSAHNQCYEVLERRDGWLNLREPNGSAAGSGGRRSSSCWVKQEDGPQRARWLRSPVVSAPVAAGGLMLKAGLRMLLFMVRRDPACTRELAAVASELLAGLRPLALHMPPPAAVVSGGDDGGGAALAAGGNGLPTLFDFFLQQASAAPASADAAAGQSASAGSSEFVGLAIRVAGVTGSLLANLRLIQFLLASPAGTLRPQHGEALRWLTALEKAEDERFSRVFGMPSCRGTTSGTISNTTGILN